MRSVRVEMLKKPKEIGMKTVLVCTALLMLIIAAGCSHRITGPGQIDISTMRKVEERCASYVLGMGPFGEATLMQRPDTIQYTVHNYLVYSSFCTAGYNR